MHRLRGLRDLARGVEPGGVVEDQLGVAEDRRQRRAHLVAHVGEEAGLDPRGDLGVALGGGEFVVPPPDLGSQPDVDVVEGGRERLDLVRHPVEDREGLLELAGVVARQSHRQVTIAHSLESAVQ